MNDFGDLEKQLRNLRPRKASADLFSRIEAALAKPAAEENKIIQPDRFKLGWVSLGLGLAAAAVVMIFTRFGVQTPPAASRVATTTPAPATTATVPSAQFIPAGATQVVYNTRDEGLRYPRGATAPVRRLRSHTRETLRWRNPTTGASLRVSYPAEQVELLPIDGQ